MDKTISITIAGLIFHMEAGAYARLDSYLAAVRRHFGIYDGSEEILQDIENRIAEIFTARTENSRRAVTGTDVDEVIGQIGTIEDFEDFDGDAGPKTSARSATQKRLYRDPDNSLLGGVAAGVAAYTGIEITITRILFIIFTLIWGASILVYLVLWLLMPVADTPAKKLEMKGEPLTLSGLEKKIKSKMPPGEEVTSSIGRFMHRIAGFFRVVGEAIVAFLRKSGPHLITIGGVILMAAGGLTALLLTALLIAMLTGPSETWMAFFPAPFVSSTFNFYLMLFSIWLLNVIPALLIALAGLALFRPKEKSGRAAAALVMLSIWVIAILVSVVVIVRDMPAY